MQGTMSWIQKLVFLSTLATLFGLAAVAIQAIGEEPCVKPAPQAEAPGDFGAEIRPVYFKAVQGDGEAMRQALEILEAKLAEEPDHPEALVYHGSLQLARGGEAFARKAIAEKRPLRKLRDDDSKLAAAKADRSIFTNAVAALTKKARGLEAPFAAADAVGRLRAAAVLCSVATGDGAVVAAASASKTSIRYQSS